MLLKEHFPLSIEGRRINLGIGGTINFNWDVAIEARP